MKIIKYLFLLALLSLVTLTIFITTQKGNFTVESSQIINSSKATVFNYVNDYKNWEKFSPWISSDPKINLSYSSVSTGKGSSLSWDGANDTGDVQTLYTKSMDTIVQKLNFNGTISDVSWTFKDTLGGTKTTWKSKGKLDFFQKMNVLFYGNTQNSNSKIYDKSLANLNKALDYENNTYDIKVNGVVKKIETFYLRQSFTSKISDINRNANIVFKKITTFCKQNKIFMNGKPFVIYHTYDFANDVAKVSFCIPIKEEILTSSGSDILSGKLKPFEGVKTTLTGNHTYNKKALDKSIEYFTTKNLIADPSFSHLEIYSIGKNETKIPSKWVTEIYYPIKPKVITVLFKPKVIENIPVAPPATVKDNQSEF